jgi:hypothetical protein
MRLRMEASTLSIIQYLLSAGTILTPAFHQLFSAQVFCNEKRLPCTNHRQSIAFSRPFLHAKYVRILPWEDGLTPPHLKEHLKAGSSSKNRKNELPERRHRL